MLSAVYTDYPIDQPPPHPGHPWTRFVCISDTHSDTFPIPPGDVLLHAGDLSSWGSRTQLKETIDWLKELPHEVKIIVAGNHDLCLERNLRTSLKLSQTQQREIDGARELVLDEEARQAGIRYLEHEALSLTVNGTTWNCYGSPAVPRFARGAFQYSTRGEAEVIWSHIPTDVEILMTHTPPLGTLDDTHRGGNAGCPVLADQLQELKQCRLHVFGHIHESHGATSSKPQLQEKTVELISVNAALAEGGQAIIVDLMKAPVMTAPR